ncbi:TPA: amidohydrolase [Listeria monocytogenes]|uniref:Amidohydrolase n=1 Tax=Listeria monocytogenes TaxID=1639 RepID=A0A5Z1JI06_LISMN|nr:amidohydrolase [Listeria monocytogenes]EAE1679415.1 amidohydrolase [Listeria monocytogenes LIS0071]EAE3711194.1 amidohydrolase [Listeria monocytogenes serotype 1/2b]EAF4602180.1 amidohydrolase [Listeria monocytogenes serotype 1/2a]EAG6253832.1 amidohydrolase [Listeria monocytogenes CFSAN003806]EAG6262751.1 amidohydrolase [Listeria monocytogenes CFSAN003725]MCX60600.1 amidohydrolase [Listeria monocytogenes serotype 4b]
MRTKLMNMLQERKDEITQIRRHLHEHPELSFHEAETAKFIQDFYKGKDVEMATEVGNGHAVVVTIKGGKPGKTIALRADFDALPIEEQTELPFKSKKPGVMHACGHDGHTAYLLVLADCLIQLKENIPGTIKIVHQHAEETPPGGAKSVVESGILDDVDQIFGIHVFPFGESGQVYYHSGFAMAGRTYFKLKIQGVGGHGSSPHMANDAIVAGAYFVTAIQTVVSRRLNPFDTGVITIGSFDGKGSFNVIKDAVELEGDVRYMNTENRDKMDAEIHRIVAGMEAMFGVTVELTYTNDYPPLYNDPAVTEQVVASLQKGVGEYLTGISEYDMLSGSEDFAYYLQKIPGVFFYIGAKPKNTSNAYFNHHPKFDIDEDALLVAAKSVADVVLDYYKLNG